MIRDVSVISLHSATRWNPQPREAIISITGSRERKARLKAGWMHVLRLKFDDVEAPTPSRKIFTGEDARGIIYFLDEISTEVDHVVVHCTHGMSRAPAIARWIAEMYDLSNGLRLHSTHNRHVYETLAREERT